MPALGDYISATIRVLHAFWLKGGPMPPLGFAKGGGGGGGGAF